MPLDRLREMTIALERLRTGMPVGENDGIQTGPHH
jgi:hypothetical protein